MERMKFCQSCRMPLSPSICGTEADGSPSQLYCTYCYQNGTFTENCTMEEMIARRAPLFANSNLDMTIEQATALLQEVFPHLTRWKQEKEN